MSSSTQGLGSYFRIIARRWWLVLLLPLVTVGVILTLSTTVEPEYAASERLQIIIVDAQEVALFSQTRSGATQEQIDAVHAEFYDVLRLQSVAWRTIADLGLNLSASDMISRIDSQHATDFITVSVRMPTPELAQKVVTAWVDHAITIYRNIRTTPAQISRSFIDEQLTAQAQTLADAKEALQVFQLENEVSDLSRETLAYQDLRRTMRTDRERAQVEAERNDRLAAAYTQLADATQARLETVRAALIVTPTTSANTRVVQPTPDPLLLAAATDLTTQVLSQRRAADEYTAAAAGQRAAIAEYDRLLDARQQELVYLLGLQERYQNLTDDVNRAAASYDFLLDKANEARLKLDQGQNIGYLQVIEPARLPEAALPNGTPQLLLAGVLISLLVAVILSFLLEVIERTVGASPAAGRGPAHFPGRRES